MRDQYAGDVSDFLKFGFLRALAGADRRLGIAWYYAPGDDGRPDGRHIEWRAEPAWKRLDAELHASLSALPERTVAALESLSFWPPGSLFHNDPMPSRMNRGAWGAAKRAALDGADLVFLDPDNGLGDEKAKNATLSEVELLRRPGRAIVFITFPGRTMPHEVLVQCLHAQLNTVAKAERVMTVRTTVAVPSSGGIGSYVPRTRWFTVVDPDASLIERASGFVDALRSVPRVTARLHHDHYTL